MKKTNIIIAVWFIAALLLTMTAPKVAAYIAAKGEPITYEITPRGKWLTLRQSKEAAGYSFKDDVNYRYEYTVEVTVFPALFTPSYYQRDTIGVDLLKDKKGD